MDVTDTKPIYKTCSKCSQVKTEELFIKQRNICKSCRKSSVTNCPEK